MPAVWPLTFRVIEDFFSRKTSIAFGISVKSVDIEKFVFVVIPKADAIHVQIHNPVADELSDDSCGKERVVYG